MTNRVKELVAEMTVEEKAGLCSGLDFWHLKGIERLGIPSIMVTDGPHGLRKQSEGADHLGINDSVPATCFPSAVGLASTWDLELIQEVGVALGKECQAENVAVLLGPGANMKRSPLCGRNFEYFSEDPFLSSRLATSHMKGVQSQGVGTSLKHFAANNQEHRRMSTDAIIDERTLREIYLASFEDAVKEAKPWTVMCAYNKVNGTYASENERLLTTILRDEWGFDGFVVSDWGAVNERVDALKAGLELEMPASNGLGDNKIIAAVKDGTLSEETLNTAVERVLAIILLAEENNVENAHYDKEDHHKLARKVAAEGTVLLKNEDSILPLSKSANLAVIGQFAKKPRFQGGGSSHINPTKLDDAVEELQKLSNGATITFAEGYEVKQDEPNDALVQEAVTNAQDADAAILFVGLPDHFESEGYDREHLNIPRSHLELIHAVSAVQPNVVVVLSNGSPIVMPWLDEVKGVVEAYLGGQAVGGAIADVLYGEANPSGRLAETFPEVLSHNPSYLNFPGEGDQVEYKEGIFIGYRYYDAKKIAPLFPFGYGLSYTDFAYSDLVVSQKEIEDTGTVDVSVTVTNVGDVFGKEVVQLYVRVTASSVVRPDKELKGFDKVALEPGESKRVTFTLDKRSFAYYSTVLGDWHVESGEFDILIGKSSAEIVQEGTVHVTSTVALPMTVTRNTPAGDILANPTLAPIFEKWMAEMNQDSPFANMSEDDESYEMFQAMMRYMPLRALVAFNSQKMTETHMEQLIAELNGAVVAK
ncbi:glycoside hydrolase family 3 C-terminal domain-containing protein [Paenalkalicoccus suaedae]|uniref:Glycoside hydrolase family 3 C-terminal domain-containing protein n=1 Tax=Paenalkalicoccus suaedae TaxID=2592382 RepID=A0A859FJA0_9BACI|nr:glycoside hydrolase family 3 C-terminal domain-containing protein [Paenalkalicoccus suaedae]QKS72645.1 glycoside hydrolase family 3 C-terminal domain-containing protein [Paenalkalicoccus suaedae]